MIATSGLLLVIFGVVRASRVSVAAFTVGVDIAAAYYFTSSKSFANPAVTIARTFSDTFAGDRTGVRSGVRRGAARRCGRRARHGPGGLPDIGEVADQVVVPHDATT